MDDPSKEDPLDCPPLRWGIISSGRVCHDFVQALKHVKTASVVSCSARREESAKAFAEKHGIEKYYGSYDALLTDENVECVYVGNIHIFRRSLVEKVLLANKHVLVEKPFALNATDAEYLMGMAKERNLFIMEGMWTRFFPAVEYARRLIFGSGDDKGILGEVVSVYSDFNFNASDSEEYPSSFLYDHSLGGGASYLVAPYPLAAATLFFPNAEPETVRAVGQVDATTGADLQAAMILSYAATSNVAPALDQSNLSENTPKLPGAGVATLSFGMLAESAEETVVLCTKGRLTICTPGHCPTKLKLRVKAEGRGNSLEDTEYDFPLPEDTEEITKAGGYFYPNSAGFSYEAAAVARCIASGKLEPPQYTLSETLISTKMIDELRDQLGVKAIDLSKSDKMSRLESV